MSGAIVVVGSLHYDIMVDAPDRPRKGETIAGTAWRPKFGGKGGNQAVAAARAGAEVRFLGAVGRDDFGRYLLAQLQAAGIDASGVELVSAAGSGMSVAISDSEGDYGAVIVSGANLKINASRLADRGIWTGAAALLLQNEIPEAVNIAAAVRARSEDLPVWLNAAPMRKLPRELSRQVTGLIVNAIEAEQLCGIAVSHLESAREAALALLDTCPMAVVTAGGAGVVGAERGGEPVSIAAEPVKVVSTHGAGDVFVGTLLAEQVRGASLAQALTRANAAAARHVSTPVAG